MKFSGQAVLRSLLFLTFMFFGARSAHAVAELAQTFTLDGQLVQVGSNLPLLDSNARIVVQILDPSKTCLLYEEQQFVNTATSDGYYSIQIGSALGAGKRTGSDPARTMAQIFQNTSAITANNAPLMTCSGGAYTPLANDSRYFRLIVTPSATMVADTLSPDTVMDSVPSAIVAQTLQGRDASQFLQPGTGDLSQTNLQTVFASGNTAKLNSLLSIPFSSYLTVNGTNNTVLVPTAATPGSLVAGQMWYEGGVLKYYDGSTTQTLGTGGTGISSLIIGTGLTPTGTISAGGSTIAVDVGTTASKIVQLDGSARLPAVNGSLLTNLNGGAIASGTIGGTTAINSSGNLQTTGDVTARRLYAYDHSGVGPGMIGIQAPADMAGSGGASYTMTLPDRAAATGQILKASNGTGTMAWGFTNIADIRSTAVGNAQFFPTNCTSGQTLVWNSMTDLMECTALAVASANITDGTIVAADLAASLSDNLWAGGSGNVYRTTGSVGIGTATPVTGTRLDITGTGAAASSIIIPRDTVANRPTTGVNGMMRYASDTNKFEAYQNGAWVDMIGGGGAGDFLANGTVAMTGAFRAANGTLALPSITFASDVNTGFYHDATDDDQIRISIGGGNWGSFSGDALESYRKIRAQNGSISAPEFAFTADNDTGMYYPAANSVGFSAGGIDVLRLNTVASGVNYVAITPAASGNGPIIGSAGAGTNIDLNITPKGTGNTIVTSGNVGIGTATLTTGTRLDIHGTGAAASSIIIPRDTVANRPTTGVNGMMRYASDTNKFEAYQNGAWVDMIGGGGGAGDFLANGTVAMTGAFRAANGTQTAPGIAFANDVNTGFYITGDNDEIKITIGGNNWGTFANNHFELYRRVRATDGLINEPAFAFAGDEDTGMFNSAANNVSLIAGGVEGFHVNTVASGVNYVAVTPAASGNGPILGSAGAGTNINLNITPKGTGNTIFTSGYVGIGTATPSGTLHVVGGTAPADTAGSDITIVTQNASGPSGRRGGTLYLTTGTGSGGWANGDMYLNVGNGNHWNQHSNNAPYAASAAWYTPSEHYVLNNSSPANGASAGPTMAVSNGNGTAQRAYFLAVSNPGAANYTPNLVWGVQTGATAYQERMRMDASGNVGIGTSAPLATLDVNGTIKSKAATVNGTAVIDFASGNLQYTAADCGAFDLTNMKDGGSYTFAVQGTAVALCSFTAYVDGVGSTTLTVHMPPDHGNTTTMKHTLYNFVVMGSHVYVAWTPGY